MKKINSFVFFLILFTICNIYANELLFEIKGDLERGMKEYEDPDTQGQSITTFNSILDKIRLLPPEILNSDEVKTILKKTYEHKGLAHFNRGEKDNSEKSFTLLIMLEPSATLDENLLSPKIMKFFKKIKDHLVGYLTVTAIPTASDIYIDGNFFGISPLYSKEIFAGNHILSVKHKGYDVIEKEFTLEPGKKLEILDVSLTLVSGICFIRTNPSGVKVFLDEEFLGITQKLDMLDLINDENSDFENMDVGELKLQYVPTGVHELLLIKDCYVDVDSKINVIVGDNLYPNFVLEVSRSTLTVMTRNNGREVYLGDKFIGVTLLKDLSLCSGEYLLKVVFPEKRLFLKTYHFKQDAVISIFAEPKPTLTFLGLYSGSDGEYLQDISLKTFNSFAEIDNISFLDLEFIIDIIRTRDLTIYNSSNFVMSDKNPEILKFQEEFVNRLSETFYSELFLFGIVDKQRELSMDATFYLFSIHESKPDIIKVSLSDFTSYRTLKDRLFRQFLPIGTSLGLSYLDISNQQGPVIIDLLDRDDLDLKVGDVITRVNDKPIQRGSEIQDYLETLDSDTKSVSIVIEREATPLTKDIELVSSRFDLDTGDNSLFFNKIIADLLVWHDRETLSTTRNLLNYNIALCYIHFHSWEKALIFLKKVNEPYDIILSKGLIDYYKGICYPKIKMNQKALECFREASIDKNASLFSSDGPKVSSLALIQLGNLQDETN